MVVNVGHRSLRLQWAVVNSKLLGAEDNGNHFLGTQGTWQKRGAQNVRAGGPGGLYSDVFPACCTHDLTAALVTASRFAQDQPVTHSSMDWGGKSQGPTLR